MPIETECYENKVVRRDDAEANSKSAPRTKHPTDTPLPVNLSPRSIGRSEGAYSVPASSVAASSDFEFQITNLPANRYLAIKSMLEFFGAAFLLILTAPVILAAVALVKLTSRGPGIYSQVRLGRFGKAYRIYKVRTMAHECEKHSGARWSTGHDPRVTPLGRLLRRTHLDELPQLWNVIRGDMSLIGPRPERPEFVPALQQAIPHYTDRLLVRPGVTGLAQVQLPADTDMESVRRKLAYDLYYVRQASFWLDVRIVFCTAFKMAGVPFPVLRGLFRMPSRFQVERAYRELAARRELAVQVQMA